MSLVSRTSSKLFATLLAQPHPEEVAIQFNEEYANDPINFNIQLTDLIFRCCGITVVEKVPYELIENEDVAGIVKIVKRLSSNAIHKFTLNKKCFDKTLLFFEYFWVLTWCDRANEDEPFIRKLVFALTKVNLDNVQFFCIRIYSKFVTSILKNQPNNFEQQITRICEQARSLLVDSFFFKDRKLLQMSLSELEYWLEFRSTDFRKDQFLCFILWSLKEITLDIVLKGLEIFERLLSDSPQTLPERFLRQCGGTIATMDIKISDEVFARVCSCCAKIQLISKNILPSDVDKKLNDHLYSTDFDETEAAADYWLAVNYTADSFQCLYNMIKHIKSFSSTLDHVDYFVDSLIGKCPVLRQWNLFGKLLVDQYEKRLTAEEKHVLLTLVVHAVQQSVTKKKPFLRRITNDIVEEEIDEEISKNITLAFKPYLKRITEVEYVNPALCLKLMTFFHFDFMSIELKENLINSCSLTFKNVPLVLIRRVALELIQKMMMNCRENDISDFCMVHINNLKLTYETQVKEMFEHFLKNPDVYRNTNAGQKLSDAFLALRLIDAIVPVEKKIAFDATIKLFEAELDLSTLWHPAFMMVEEICVILCTKYVLRNLRNQSVTAEKVQEHDVYIMINNFSHRLKKHCGERVGMEIFCGLCDVAEYFKNAGFMYLFPKTTINAMDYYFRITLRKPCSKDKISDFRGSLMKKYLNMIDQDVLPMEYAYNALSVHCNINDVKYEQKVHRFLELQCEKRDPNYMVKWMTKLWTQIYEREFKNEKESKNVLQTYQKLRDLIYPIRSKLSNVLYGCHIAGIDYFTSEAKYSEFARILSIFSACLSMKDKPRVLDYVIKKPSGQNSRSMEFYIRSLKVGGKMIVRIDDSSTHDSLSTGTSGDDLNRLSEDGHVNHSDIYLSQTDENLNVTISTSNHSQTSPLPTLGNELILSEDENANNSNTHVMADDNLNVRNTEGTSSSNCSQKSSSGTTHKPGSMSGNDLIFPDHDWRDTSLIINADENLNVRNTDDRNPSDESCMSLVGRVGDENVSCGSDSMEMDWD